MYAIIATGGKQYKVSEGDVIKVEKLDVAPGNTVSFDQVIAVSDGTLKVGEDVAKAPYPQPLWSREEVRRLLYISTREKPATTRRTVTDKHTLRLRSTRSMHNDNCSDL